MFYFFKDLDLLYNVIWEAVQKELKSEVLISYSVLNSLGS